MFNADLQVTRWRGVSPGSTTHSDQTDNPSGLHLRFCNIFLDNNIPVDARTIHELRCYTRPNLAVLFLSSATTNPPRFFFKAHC